MRALTDALLRVDLVAQRPDRRSAGNQEQESLRVGVGARNAALRRVSRNSPFCSRPRGIAVGFEKKDGEAFQAGDTLLRLEGDQNELLSLERVGLNLLQRMSGIATLDALPAGARARPLPVHADRRARAKRCGACSTSARCISAAAERTASASAMPF